MSLCYWYLISPCSWTYFEGCELQEYRLQRYYTAADIAGHNTAHNCWVSFFGRVYASWRKIPSWIHVVDSKVWKKHGEKTCFSEKWECSEECGNISKNKRIDHANLRDFCVWPRDATLSGISFPITLQIAPVIVPLIMFSFDPRSPCPSRMGISKRYRSRLAQDLTPLLAEYKGPLAQPIIAAAGSDISFWFDEASRSKRHPEPL